MACLLMAVDAAGQTTAPSVFRSTADLVALSVVVTDRDQRFVSGLDRDDFLVLEDGVPQDLSFFATAQVPLDLALLLDTSGSMFDAMPILRTAASNFVRTLRPGDRAMVVDIKNTARTIAPLGSDVDSAVAAIARTTARGATGLYNGLYLTLRGLEKARRDQTGVVRRQAIVVFSDGMDTASLLDFDDVMDVAKETGIAIYTITLRTGVRQLARGSQAGSPSEFAMKQLAEDTGARAFFPTAIRELASVYSQIATELANQYAIGYVPTNTDRGRAFRHVAVDVPDRPGVRTRTRAGYIVPRAAASE